MKGFLSKVEMTLLQELDKKDERKLEDWSKGIKGLRNNLANIEQVIVPTDKTNSFCVNETDKYIDWVEQYLKELATDVNKLRLAKIYNDTIELLQSKLEVTNQRSQGTSEWWELSHPPHMDCVACTGIGYPNLSKTSILVHSWFSCNQLCKF